MTHNTNMKHLTYICDCHVSLGKACQTTVFTEWWDIPSYKERDKERVCVYACLSLRVNESVSCEVVSYWACECVMHAWLDDNTVLHILEYNISHTLYVISQICMFAHSSLPADKHKVSDTYMYMCIHA